MQDASVFEPGERLLRRADAARYLREKFSFPCSTQWLAKLAVIGGGPPYYKAGRNPVYTTPHLDVWGKNRLGRLRRSTSDVGPTSQEAADDGA